MKLEELDVKKIFDIRNVYSIPSYQRDYKWEYIEVDTLISDFLDFYIRNKEQKKHALKYFLGIIIVQEPDNEVRNNEGIKFYLIDGQQRLTTLYLLMKVIIDIRNNYKLIDESEPEENIKIDKRQEYNEYFKNTRKEKGMLKLQNRNKELENFIFNEKNEYQNIKKAYDIIFNKVNNYFKDYESLKEFEACLENVVLGSLNVDKGENAEELFENINSKNKMLTISELIKNKLLLINNSILKKNSSNFQEAKNENEKIESKILNIFDKIENLQNKIEKKHTKFNFLNVKKKEDIVRSIMSNILGIFIESDNESYKKNIKKELETRFSENFDIFKKNLFKIENIFETFEIINEIINANKEESLYLNWIFEKSSAFLIYLPNDILNFCKTNKINFEFNKTKEIDEKLLNYIKNIFIIITKASIASSGFSGINMWKALPQSVKFKNEILNWEVMLDKIINKNSYYDENHEFNDLSINDISELIMDKSLYKDNKKLAKLLLILIEKKENNNLKWGLCNSMYKSNKWNAEQVMPKKIDFHSQLGKDWLKIIKDENHTIFVDTIGNLILSNLKLHNKSFFSIQESVRDMKININSDLLALKNFSIEDLKKRTKLLKNKILDVLK